MAAVPRDRAAMARPCPSLFASGKSSRILDALFDDDHIGHHLADADDEQESADEEDQTTLDNEQEDDSPQILHGSSADGLGATLGIHEGVRDDDQRHKCSGHGSMVHEFARLSINESDNEPQWNP